MSVCLADGDLRWPVDLTDMDMQILRAIQYGTSKEMEALRGVGLVQETTTAVNSGFGNFVNMVTTHHFVLTEKARPYMKNEQVMDLTSATGTSTRSLLCVGVKTLSDIVKWEEPMRMGDFAEADVYYRYTFSGLPDWARTPLFVRTFPALRSADLTAPQDSQAPVELTSNGWEVKGASMGR